MFKKINSCHALLVFHENFTITPDFMTYLELLLKFCFIYEMYKEIY